MPKTRLQRIVFALLMVIFMVVAMEFYNQGLIDGVLTWEAMARAIGEMKIMMPICFIMSYFLADPIASWLTAKTISNNSDKLLVTFYRASITVSIMCPIMSFWATLMFQQPGLIDFIPSWLTTVSKNLPMAFFWQLLFCGPLVRFLFRHIFNEEGK